MKTFRFPLQPIRTLRERKEETCQQAFARAMRACEEAAFQLQAASGELTAGWDALCRDLASGVSATKLARTRAWCAVLEMRQKERAAALKAARHAMEVALREMLVATRDREAIDTYHDKCRNVHNRLVQRDEQKTLDELGVRGPARREASLSPHRRSL